MLGRIAEWMGRTRDREAWVLLAVRSGLPLATVIAGVVLIVVGHAGVNSPTAVTGLVMIGIAVMVWLLNRMFRLSIESNRDREREELAREFYDRHGHWPDDAEDFVLRGECRPGGRTRGDQDSR